MVIYIYIYLYILKRNTKRANERGILTGHAFTKGISGYTVKD